VKDERSAQIYGYNVEYKLCALVFVRAKNLGYKFELASNMKGLGAFGEVVVGYLDNSRKKHIFVKHTEYSSHDTYVIRRLLEGYGDYSLREYYESYIKIEEKFNCSEEGVKLEGSIDESLFIVYTTVVRENLQSNKITDIGEAEFLMTGGFVQQFNEEEHKDIYEHLQKLPKHREFLSRFRIFYNQAEEEEMDRHIKSELQQIMKLPERELDVTYLFFLKIMKDWWQHEKFFLKNINSRENDPLRKTTEKMRTIRNGIRGNPNLTNSSS